MAFARRRSTGESAGGAAAVSVELLMGSGDLLVSSDAGGRRVLEEIYPESEFSVS